MKFIRSLMVPGMLAVALLVTVLLPLNSAQAGAVSPQVRNISINNGATTTDSPQVTLQFDVDYAAKMIIGNDALFGGIEWEAYAPSKAWTLNPVLGKQYVYVRFRTNVGIDSSLQVLSIDLVAPNGATPPEEPVTPPAPGAYVPHVGGNNTWIAGTWVKTADQSTVYFVDSNMVRHAYPNASVWFTYIGVNFSDIRTISSAEMAAMPLGRNVPFNYGTLFKIPSVSKVYVVDGNATVRWITTEALAAKYFGDKWATKVYDLNEAFFSDYTVGLPITE